MTFGFKGRMSRRRAMVAGAALLSTLAVTAMSGCGGGGGTTTNPTPDPTQTVPVFGQLLDVGSGLAVPGAIISFNGAQAVTDSNGNFSVRALPTTVSQNVTVATPTDSAGQPAYHSTVVYNNRIYNSGSFPIGATIEAPTGGFDVKQIYVANISYPPFPPDF